jgi:hypothetical protein
LHIVRIGDFLGSIERFEEDKEFFRLVYIPQTEGPACQSSSSCAMLKHRFFLCIAAKYRCVWCRNCTRQPTRSVSPNRRHDAEEPSDTRQSSKAATITQCVGHRTTHGPVRGCNRSAESNGEKFAGNRFVRRDIPRFFICFVHLVIRSQGQSRHGEKHQPEQRRVVDVELCSRRIACTIFGISRPFGK